MRLGPASWRRLALAAALAVGASGCGLTHLHDLNFRVDDRLHFLTPKDRSTVHAPLTVAWTMRDFTVAAPRTAPPSRDAGYFVVFVDQAPIRPGQTVKAIAHGDPVCERDPKCPDEAYLNGHGVYTTTKTAVTLHQILDLLGSREKLQMHTITVVLLDTAGRRIGESAWELDVRAHRLSTV